MRESGRYVAVSAGPGFSAGHVPGESLGRMILVNGLLPSMIDRLHFKPYRRQPAFIEAATVDTAGPIETVYGQLWANVGDYLVHDEEDKVYLLRPDVFHRLYERNYDD